MRQQHAYIYLAHGCATTEAPFIVACGPMQALPTSSSVTCMSRTPKPCRSIALPSWLASCVRLSSSISMMRMVPCSMSAASSCLRACWRTPCSSACITDACSNNWSRSDSTWGAGEQGPRWLYGTYQLLLWRISDMADPYCACKTAAVGWRLSVAGRMLMHSVANVLTQCSSLGRSDAHLLQLLTLCAQMLGLSLCIQQLLFQ